MSLESLNAMLTQYYTSAAANVSKSVMSANEQMKTKAMSNMAARGIAGSGAAEKELATTYDKNATDTVAGINGQFQGAQAGALSQLFGQEQQNKFQEDMLNKQRQWQNEDFGKNLVTNLVSGASSAILTPALGAVGYKAASGIDSAFAQSLLNPKKGV